MKSSQGDDKWLSVNLYGIDFDSTRVRFQSAPNHNPLYTNVTVFADDLSRTVSYTHASNNEIASMTEVDKGVTTYAFDDWGRMATETRNGKNI